MSFVGLDGVRMISPVVLIVFSAFSLLFWPSTFRSITRLQSRYRFTNFTRVLVRLPVHSHIEVGTDHNVLIFLT